MLGSVTTLKRLVSAPLRRTCGQSTKLLSIEVHGDKIKGLALMPGKVVKYVLEAQSNKFRVSDMLSVLKSSKLNNNRPPTL